jgi:hypothetical protein
VGPRWSRYGPRYRELMNTLLIECLTFSFSTVVKPETLFGLLKCGSHNHQFWAYESLRIVRGKTGVPSGNRFFGVCISGLRTTDHKKTQRFISIDSQNKMYICMQSKDFFMFHTLTDATRIYVSYIIKALRLHFTNTSKIL